jgi:low temperature requirement protein LtrA
MFNFLDKKQFFTIVLAGVALFFLTKYFTKKVTKADGSVAHYVGIDGSYI